LSWQGTTGEAGYTTEILLK